MLTYKQPVKGDSLWIVIRKNGGGLEAGGFNATISKVGNKYFSVTSNEIYIPDTTRFYKKTYRQDTSTVSGYELFNSEQERADINTINQLASKFSLFFKSEERLALSLNDFLAIDKLIVKAMPES